MILMAQQFLAQQISPLLQNLFFMSISATFIGISVMFIRKILDEKISPSWKNTLWCLMFLALLLPYRFPSSLAVLPKSSDFSIGEQEQQTRFVASSYGKGEDGSHLYPELFSQYQQAFFSENREEIEGEIGTEFQEENMENHQVYHQDFSDYLDDKVENLHLQALLIEGVLPLLWLVGMVAISTIFLIGKRRFSIALKEGELPTNPQHSALLDGCKSKLNCQRKVTLCTQNILHSPGISGAIKPCIFLPEYANSLSESSLECILLHELSHLKRGDLWKNQLILLLQTLYWFNPVLWLLFRFVREDLELANDHEVLKILEENKRKNYAISLVEVLGHHNKIPLAPQLLTMVDGKKNMKRRIRMMQLGDYFKEHKMIMAMGCLAVIGLLSGLFLTQPASAQQEDNPTLLQQNDNSTKLSLITMKVDGYSLVLPEDLAFFSSDYPPVRVFTQNIRQEGDFSNSFWEGHHLIHLEVTQKLQGEWEEWFAQLRKAFEEVALEEGKNQDDILIIQDAKPFIAENGDKFEYIILNGVDESVFSPFSYKIYMFHETGTLELSGTYETEQQKNDLALYFQDIMSNIVIDDGGLQESHQQTNNLFPSFYKTDENGQEILIEIPDIEEKDSVDPDLAPHLVFLEQLMVPGHAGNYTESQSYMRTDGYTMEMPEDFILVNEPERRFSLRAENFETIGDFLFFVTSGENQVNILEEYLKNVAKQQKEIAEELNLPLEELSIIQEEMQEFIANNGEKFLVATNAANREPGNEESIWGLEVFLIHPSGSLEVKTNFQGKENYFYGLDSILQLLATIELSPDGFVSSLGIEGNSLQSLPIELFYLDENGAEIVLEMSTEGLTKAIQGEENHT